MRKMVTIPATLGVAAWLFACGCLLCASTAAADNAMQALIVYYSRTGKAQMVATALKNRLGCDIAPIVSKRDIGIATITLDQLFGRDDEQVPFTRNLTRYNPVILVSPIWFMKLSSPARTFIEQHPELKGRDLYIITTSGGPMERKNEAIAAYAREKGLTVKGVFNIGKVMKKTQEEIDRDVAELLKKMPYPGAPPSP